LNFWTVFGVVALIGAAALLYMGFDSTPRQTLLILEGGLLGMAGLRCIRRGGAR